MPLRLRSFSNAHGVAAGLEDVDFCCGGTEAEGRLLVPVQPIQHRGRQGTHDLLDVVEVGYEVSMLDSFVMCDPVAQCSQPIELAVDIVPLDLWCEQALERREPDTVVLAAEDPDPRTGSSVRPRSCRVLLPRHVLSGSSWLRSPWWSRAFSTDQRYQASSLRAHV
jgi:hypothetical protein